MGSKSNDGRRNKIEIKMIENPATRMVAFSKRHQDLFKKLNKLYSLFGASSAATIVFSLAGNPFVYGNPSVDSVLNRFLASVPASTAAVVPAAIATATISDASFDSRGREIREMERWVEAIDAQECGDLEELLALRDRLEEAMGRIEKRLAEIDEDAFCSSLLLLD